MIDRVTPEQQELLQMKHGPSPQTEPGTGGNMSYHRFIINPSTEPVFVKAFDGRLLDVDWRRQETWQFLEKEYRIYKHLHRNDFQHTPDQVEFVSDMLMMTAHREQDGWFWRAPTDDTLRSQYIADVIGSFAVLQDLPAPSRHEYDENAMEILYDHGWDKLHELDVPTLIDNNLERWSDNLWPSNIQAAAMLRTNLDQLLIKRVDTITNAFNHHDARQANIAWHPEHGVSIVDWSWADAGLPNGDATMLLLDLYKSGYDIAEYADIINPTYAKLMLGYWLQRSQTQHMEGNDTVRMHQFISAISASTFLLQIMQ